jgi:hypothetical protein
LLRFGRIGKKEGMGMGTNAERILTVHICHESQEIDGTLYHTWLNLDEWPPGLYINADLVAHEHWGPVITRAFDRWADYELTVCQEARLPVPSLS